MDREMARIVKGRKKFPKHPPYNHCQNVKALADFEEDLVVIAEFSFQDADIEEKLARISLTLSQSPNEGVLPPAPNKPCTSSSSKIPVSAN